MMQDLKVEFLGINLWLAVILAALFLSIVYLYYRRTTPPLQNPMKWFLITLRSLAIIFLFLALVQPILNYSRVKYRKKTLAVMIDRSASMDLPAAPQTDLTRKEAAEEILNDPEFKRLLNNTKTTYYSFAESLDVSRSGVNLPGNRTSLGPAFGELQRLTALDPPDYVLLISDGRATEGGNPAAVAADLNFPVYTIAVGDSIRTDDVSLDRLVYDDVIFTGRPAEIKVHLSQQGSFPGKFRLSLYDGDRLLADKSILPPGAGKSGEYEISFTPNEPGRLILDLDVNPGIDEANRLNNRKKFSVRVLKSKMRILLYASSVNQEYGFLNRFLKDRPDYEVISVIDAPGGNRLGEGFPNSQEALNSFDLVILVDPNLNRLKSDYDRVRSFLSDRGGGLMILMGREYLMSAANNRLAELSPLAVTARRQEKYKRGQYHLVPNQRMIFHPAVGLGETRDETMALWSSQPPFTAAVEIDSLRSSGVALAFLEGDFQLRNMPAMALRRVQAGKILAVTVSPFWRWAFLPVGVGRDISPYRNFFAGSIRWLTIGDESDRINIQPLTEVFESGEQVIFVGAVHDEGFRPIENATGNLVISMDNQDSTVVRILPDPSRPGRYLAEVGILAAGEYNYRAELSAEGVRLGRFQGKFAVDEINREIARADVDWSYLQGIARATGGLFAGYDNIIPVIEAVDPEQTREVDNREIRLWSNIILLIIIVVALSMEWFVRKNRQLL